MTRRNEDFDELCDPENPQIIKYEDILEAAKRIKKFITPTPCLASHYQRESGINIYYKLETVQRTGSFKERGAINALQLLPRDSQKIGVVVASLGNHAMGICYYGQKLEIPITVIMPTCVAVIKMQLCQNLGAKVIVQGNNLVDAQKYARAYAKDKGLTYIKRDYPNIICGYGTIAVEILEQIPCLDAIIVPVGSGGLVASVATVVKHLKPECLVYGVQSERLPTFFKSLEAGEPITLPYEPSIAEGIAMPYVGVNAFYNVKDKLDKLLLVKEDWVARAILHLVENERFVVEGAGACPLAAIIGNLVPELKTKNVVCICSGGNIDAVLLGRSLDRGLAAEGRLIKFKVLIKDFASAYEELMKLLAAIGCNIIRQFQDRIWVENEIYRVEIKIVCETRDVKHALELKRIIERAYPDACLFETEPFNDDKTCPCYAKCK
ncbi:L-threonine ammonia-lyase-like [Melitaea cinxia]|uniref:L-threonine ammonia-lyase-like n=1 Tax=Melitaea cinxia TaxID=113334 RepID=UPI001E272DAD|nr:L-threonine ammonia-lyase-like [Melitaea cinxia]